MNGSSQEVSLTAASFSSCANNLKQGSSDICWFVCPFRAQGKGKGRDDTYASTCMLCLVKHGMNSVIFWWHWLQVGCMGFCMGGALTLSISQSGKIDCGVPCYGLPSQGHGEVSTFAKC